MSIVSLALRRGMLAAAIIVVLLSASPAYAGDDKDPIDAALDACLATTIGLTTSGMIDCTGNAIKAWDTRLNETYQKALTALDPKSRDLLRAAQRQWVAFRKAERAAELGPWFGDGGSILRLQIMANDISAIRERVAELQVYIQEN